MMFDRINELGTKIQELNLQIQRVEAGKVETAMDLRDQRDLYLDELSSLAKVSYSENVDGIVKVQIDNVEFVTENNVYQMAMHEDKLTGFQTPYWPQLSDTENEDYYYVFDTDNANAPTARMWERSRRFFWQEVAVMPIIWIWQGLAHTTIVPDFPIPS